MREGRADSTELTLRGSGDWREPASAHREGPAVPWVGSPGDVVTRRCDGMASDVLETNPCLSM